MFSNGIVFFGLLVTLGMSIYAIVFPDAPSDSIIAAAGIKVINVGFDTSFFVKQRSILKNHRSVISEANYAAALAALLFDSVTLVSLVVIWLLRNNPIGLYISPVISIFIAIFLIVKCIKQTKIALEDLTDKTLPEEQQLKVLGVLTKHYDSYSYFHSINSHKTGDITRVDIHLSFDNHTSFEKILNLKNQMQDELADLLGNCIVNIIVEND